MSFLRARSAILNPSRAFSAARTRNMKVVGVFYKGGEHAKEQPKLLGTVENQLGIREWLESQGHTYVVTDDKEGSNSTFDKEIVDADIIISTPFHPAYITRERIAKAKNLKACVTAGIGSDHVDLNAANERKVGVYEVTGSNVVSVAEHVILTILALVRNFVPSHEMVIRGDWEVAAVAKNSYDLEGKVVATIGVGRIGERVLRRLKPFDCKELLYYDYASLPADVEKEIGCRRIETLEEIVSLADIVTINCPLHEGTKGLFNKDLIAKMKKGAWLVNTARGAICVPQDVADAVNSGHLMGYGGDVWDRQPAPRDHPWRSMQYLGKQAQGGNAMTPHMSGTTLDAQARYAAGTKDILDNFFKGNAQKPTDVICEGGEYVSKAYGERAKLADKAKDFRAYEEKSN